MALTFDVRGRRSGEDAEGTCKRSLQAVPLDGMVSRASLFVIVHGGLLGLLYLSKSGKLLACLILYFGYCYRYFFSRHIFFNK